MPGSSPELTARITKEVIARLNAEQPQACSSGTAMVITNAGRDIPGILAQVQAVAGCCDGELTIVMVPRLCEFPAQACVPQITFKREADDLAFVDARA